MARMASAKIGKTEGAIDGPRSAAQLSPAGHCDAMTGVVKQPGKRNINRFADSRSSLDRSQILSREGGNNFLRKYI